MKLVYFIQDSLGGEIRIGVAREGRLEKRLQTLQLGNPNDLKLLGLIKARNADTLARELHSTFSDAHVRGEWFKPEADLLSYIRSRASLR
ncbi:MAG: GIY-YIG nuclease family protein [Gemmatimonadota bacterium]|nr:MAG: GIY-YIG nuclease family protein [Gemmatimonadota bacterium]